MIRNGSTTQLVGIELLPVLDQKRLSSLVAQKGKNLPAVQETWGRKILWRRAWLPTPVFLPGESHGQRSEPGGLQPIRSQRVRHDLALVLRLPSVLSWTRLMTVHSGVLRSFVTPLLPVFLLFSHHHLRPWLCRTFSPSSCSLWPWF